MRRRRPEEEAEQPTQKRAGGSTQGGILALQQSAGNHAVTQMLARDAKDKAPGKAPASDTVIDFGKDGRVIGLVSVNMGSSRAITGSGTGGAQPDLKEATCTAYQGDHSGDVLQWATNGKHFAVVTLKFKNTVTWTLHDVMVVNYQPGGSNAEAPMESWSISFAKAEVDFKEAKDEKKP